MVYYESSSSFSVWSVLGHRGRSSGCGELNFGLEVGELAWVMGKMGGSGHSHGGDSGRRLKVVNLIFTVSIILVAAATIGVRVRRRFEGR
jgi:hypothetical protein